MRIVGDAFSGLLSDLSLNISFRFGLSFSWPSALPMSNLVQLAVSLAVIGAKYAFAIYALIVKYVIGMDAGATWLNTNMITQIFQLVAFTVFALAKLIATAQEVLMLRQKVRELNNREDKGTHDLELATTWLGLCTTLGRASRAARIVEKPKLRLDLRDVQTGRR